MLKNQGPLQNFSDFSKVMFIEQQRRQDLGLLADAFSSEQNNSKEHG